MKRIKAILVAMVFAVAAVFAFAFNKSEAEAEPKTEKQTFWYGNEGGGVYRLLDGPPTGGDCDEPDNFPCTIESIHEVEEGFDYANKPDGSVDSPETGVYSD